MLAENCEIVIPGFLDFCLYCINDTLIETKLYGGKLTTKMIYHVVYEYFCKRQNDMIKAIKKHGVFRAPSSFKHTKLLVDGYVSQAMNMGEGWLLTAEMLELIEQGVNNIVCTQPFGCLPNHIVGRGMMKTIKEKNPQSNIVSIDYDPGATKVNQENRIKLMLSNAKKELEYAEAAMLEAQKLAWAILSILFVIALALPKQLGGIESPMILASHTFDCHEANASRNDNKI